LRTLSGLPIANASWNKDKKPKEIGDIESRLSVEDI
jgi:hypothetical protein